MMGAVLVCGDPGFVKNDPTTTIFFSLPATYSKSNELWESTDAGGFRQSSEYRARHVNDECSEAAVPLPRARKGTEHANVLV